jgi:undecaprenyl-diphosphatase
MKKVFLLILFSTFLLSFDKKVEESNSFLLTSHYPIPYYLGYAVIGTALYEGNSETRFGKTTWKAFDSLVLTNIATEGLKRTFSRVRPRNADSPDEWFESGNKSFPSGHVSATAGVVTPYILEYQDDYPLIHLLWLLPIQQMAGRVNAAAHWQSDVLAGAVLGTLIGWWSWSRETPFLLYFSEDGIYTGIKYRF